MSKYDTDPRMKPAKEKVRNAEYDYMNYDDVVGVRGTDPLKAIVYKKVKMMREFDLRKEPPPYTRKRKGVESPGPTIIGSQRQVLDLKWFGNQFNPG